MPWPDELVVELVVAQYVTHVLAEKTLDALPELLNPVHVRLRRAPGSIGRIRRARFERLDALLRPEVPGDIRDQVLDQGERPHRLDRDRLIRRQRVHPRHAHQTGLAVDFGRARAAFARFAVPAHGQVVRLVCLNLMDGIEHHHAFGDLRLVFPEVAAGTVTAPDAKRCTAHLFSSITFLSSGGMSGIACRSTIISPFEPLRMTMLNVANALTLSG